MTGADLHADARLALRHHGIVEASDVDAFVLQTGSEALGEGSIVEHHGTNGTLRGFDVETAGHHLVAEVGDILHQAVVQFVRLVQHLEDFQRSADDAGSQRVREEVGARALAQQVDDFLSTCREAAHGTAEGFAQRAGVDIYTAVGVVEFAHSAACLADDACRVALVHHHHSIVLLCQVADLVHRSHIAVHREDTISDHDAETLFLGGLQLALQIFHVGVGVAVALGLAQTHTVNDAGVVQGVADDGILLGQQGFEDTTVGIEAGRVENGVLRLEETADGGFQLLVNILRTADEAHTRHAVAATVHHLLCSLDEAGVVR